MGALILLAALLLLAVYAPLFASSKPLAVRYDGELYFPLLRYLFYRGFYTKAIDLFFNLLMVTLPLFVLGALLPIRKWACLGVGLLQIGIFLFLLTHPVADPAASFVKGKRGESWAEELDRKSAYGRLNLALRYQLRKRYHEQALARGQMVTPWQIEQERLEAKRKRLQLDPEGGAKLAYLDAKEEWLASQKLEGLVMPLLRPFHWEEHSVTRHSENQWWLRSRVNGKDLVAALFFGIRVSIVVGVIATLLALLLGVPLGAIAGFHGGKLDILLCRLIEVWEAMPTFLMLLLTVAILQSKSIFLVIGALAFFSWPPLCRMVRAEVLRQKALPYVQACRSQGYPSRTILFREILPNAIPPVVSLLPFALMVAITSEAGLAFLGLGEEGSCSLGVLMDEGRAAFPADSGLLWPPAILLSLLLIAIALVGDTLRDALDPKLRGA
ncbi:MAG: ABC transporter permease [Parachlamydiales bacterium]